MDNKKIISASAIVIIFLVNWGLIGNFYSAKALTSDDINSGIDFISNLGTTGPNSMPEINLRQFLSPSGISKDDLIGAIKALVTLVFNIFITVISVVYQIIMLGIDLLVNRGII